MHPSLIPNRARLLELCDKPNGIVQWAEETLCRYDLLRQKLGTLTELDAETARLDYQESLPGHAGMAQRQSAVRILRHLPGGLRTAARFLNVTVDRLATETFGSITGDQLLILEELMSDATLARRQVSMLADVTQTTLDAFAGPDDRNATNRQIRTLIEECIADGISLEATRAVLAEAGHNPPYKRVWETYTRAKTKGMGR